jgi:ubiquinone/menaquinone biosynthesis C-methylase UbiE
MSIEINKDYLKNAQYKKSDYLEARIAIHKFTTSKETFQEWIWNQIKIEKPVKILEVGCGTGAFWKLHLSKLQAGSKVLMTDFSSAMIEKAKSNVSGDNVQFEVADVENLSYEDSSFDLVMAHHILYHASDKDKALKELKRVCKIDGRLTITTNSERHMLKVYETGQKLDPNFPTDRIIDTFTEEIADTDLPKCFANIDKRVCEEYLHVTDIDIMLDYVRSGVEPRNIKVSNDFYDRYREIVTGEIKDKGYYEIMKRSPLYICT